ncbi:MAG: phosphate signaling complex protein PhoU [Xanthomonadaceae bacterium]|nr:phosphate signaling complex protein PhoU [Xanthomonadaceae bacterium]MDP2184017.1 phosphate signaling complex protein PhoU [Xanthomonadales bacterium]MDZ4115278.1 phosphate signaling complex protein PhoU [Xanthomonadaceae bacterium]MDZ4377182.1 phosphate signaling complex protein PhoU [Xanthomonadaceae bacterium]
MSMTTGAHTLKKFDEELATLRDLVLKMGGEVEEQVSRAISVLEGGDSAIAREVIKRDREIDRLELKADEEIAQLLALRSPLGVDLRTVLTLSKTVNDLERVGDEAKKIARIALQLHEEGHEAGDIAQSSEISALSQHALSMLRGALDALVRLDLERAAQVKAADDTLDDGYKAIIASIKDFANRHPDSVGQVIQVMFAMKALERIGDHAKNIAQYVFYLVEGRDIRHPKSNPAATPE